MAELQAGASYQLLVHNGDISYARGYGTQVTDCVAWLSVPPVRNCVLRMNRPSGAVLV
jgi:hypothetical protein